MRAIILSILAILSAREFTVSNQPAIPDDDLSHGTSMPIAIDSFRRYAPPTPYGAYHERIG